MAEINPYIAIPEQADFISESDLDNGIFDNVNSFQIGYGERVMRADSSGLWMGAEKFVDAPFSVDMEGNMIATSLTLSGYLQVGEAMQDVIDDASFNELSDLENDLGSITAGSITGVTLTGNTIRTSSSGARVEITGADDRIDWYNSSNFNTATFDDTGLYFWKGVEDVGGYLTLDSSDNMVLSADGRMELFGSDGIYTWDDIYIDGDIIPFINNLKDIGSTSLRIRKGYFYDVDIADDLVVTDDLSVGDDLTVGDNATITGWVNVGEELTVGETLDMTAASGFVNLPRMTGAIADTLISTDGSMYYRTDDNKIRVKINGSWVSLN